MVTCTKGCICTARYRANWVELGGGWGGVSQVGANGVIATKNI